MDGPLERYTSMNEQTSHFDRYFVAMANERIARMDLVGARRLARQAASASRDDSTFQRALARLRRVS